MIDGGVQNVGCKSFALSSYRANRLYLRQCEVVHLPIHFGFVRQGPHIRLRPLIDLLDGLVRTNDENGLWTTIETEAGDVLGRGTIRIQAAALSPDRRNLAVCCEVRTLLGFKVQHAGIIYSLDSRSIVGHVSRGRRTPNGWAEIKG